MPSDSYMLARLQSLERGNVVLRDDHAAILLALERITELESALEPFAELATTVDLLGHEDNSTCEWRLLARDLRAARDAISPAKQETRDAE